MVLVLPGGRICCCVGRQELGHSTMDGVMHRFVLRWVILYIRVPFRSPKQYGTLMNKDPKRDPNLENYPI